MNNKRLWAPWRSAYVTAIDQKKKGCVFCRIHSEQKDKKNLIFKRSQHCFAVLNIFPYNNGHAMVIPYRHVGELRKLTKFEKQDLLDTLEYAQALLDKVLKPQGYNIGINVGRLAGAGFPNHFHIHIVPRWKGDVNFMPVTAGTKVISQSMTVVFKELCREDQRRNRKA
ncbi:MAG TPA: HIT domain-containing protein [Candidatus Omnitrophota bacterium]|nr:HIT domain-containing protein [Candidatus Omnitrophota bacterium]